MTKKIMLITGSSGRIGKVCVHHFADEYEVIGFDRLKTTHEKAMHHMTVDVSSEESVQRALSDVKAQFGTKIESVIHLAAYYSFANARPELYDLITVQGTERLLKHLQNFEVGQFLFSSTILVHAPCKLGEKIDEKWPLLPKWDYPRSKVKTEKVIHAARGKIPTVIMRIAGCYDDLCHSIPIAHNIQRIYEHQWEAHLYPGDKQHGNPFLHLNDLVKAIDSTVKLRKQLPDELTMVIGEEKTASYQEFQNNIAELLEHRDFQVFRVPKWVAKVGAAIQSHLPFVTDDFIQPWMIDLADDHYALDITLAKNMIDWTPKHYVLDSLPIMIDLLKQDPLKWYRANQLTPPTWLEAKV